MSYECSAQWLANGNNIYNTNTGNIGIGTSTPSYNLFINGNDYPFGVVNATLNNTSNMGETSIFFGDVSSGVKMLRASKRTYNTRAFEIWSEYGFNSPSKSAEFYHDYINFYTADLKRLTIDGQGSVGIGTTAPRNKLSVASTFVNGIIDQTIGVTQENGAASYGGYIGQRAVSANTRQWLVVSGNGSLTLNANAYNMDFINGAITAATDANLVMRITAAGNVGIGSAAPTTKLAVATSSNNASVDQIISVVQSNGVTSFGGYIGQRAVSENTRQGLIVSGTGSLTLNANTYNLDFITGAITAATDTNLAMRITSGGNVGIGMAAPDAKLAVAGTIHSQAVKVDMAGWSDYVFKPTYKLPSIAQVKSYIDQHHHLPDMPSANEVMKNGIDVGEIINIQTKKIEELTLYLIEKDYKEKVQEEKFVHLQQEIKQLKDLIKMIVTK